MNNDSICGFRKYLTKEILPASKELENLPDTSRKHLQKLTYTNLVDRFDAMVDATLLDNVREDALVEMATGKMNNQVLESDLISLLLKGDDLQDALDNKLKLAIQNGVLRERHSKKVSTLFSVFQGHENVQTLPRVNISNGKIMENKIKPTSKTIPYSICGFCDWLYSRRNAVVHGGGSSSYLKNDIAQLKKLYKCTPATRVIVKLGAVSTAATFYIDVVDLIEFGEVKKV